MPSLENVKSRWPIVLNQSSYKEFQNCQRLFAWRRLQNLTPPSRRSALEIGTAVHSGLATFHGGGIDVSKLEEPIPPSDGAPEVEIEAYQEALVKYETWTEAAKQSIAEQALFVAQEKLRERSGPTTSFEDKDLGEAQAIVDRVLPAYIDHYRETDELWKPLNQEIECLVEVGLPGSGVWLRMRADNLSVAKGGLYIVDYKTAGRMDPRDLLKYEMDIQISSYIYGLSKFLTEQSLAEGGEPIVIRGAIIDVLVKTQVPQFARELYTRTEAELAEFEVEFNFVAYDIASRFAMVRGDREAYDHFCEECWALTQQHGWKVAFPRNTDNCFRYGTCSFRDVCLKDTPVRRALYDRREPDYVDEAQAQLDGRPGAL
jgi:RecB family exonuclease